MLSERYEEGKIYYIQLALEEILIDGVEPSFNDVVLAYNDDVLVGSSYWAGKNTAVPVMGRDYSDETNGFCESGDNITFKLYSFETGDIINLNGNIAHAFKKYLIFILYLY